MRSRRTEAWFAKIDELNCEVTQKLPRSRSRSITRVIRFSQHSNSFCSVDIRGLSVLRSVPTFLHTLEKRNPFHNVYISRFHLLMISLGCTPTRFPLLCILTKITGQLEFMHSYSAFFGRFFIGFLQRGQLTFNLLHFLFLLFQSFSIVRTNNQAPKIGRVDHAKMYNTLSQRGG